MTTINTNFTARAAALKTTLEACDAVLRESAENNTPPPRSVGAYLTAAAHDLGKLALAGPTPEIREQLVGQAVGLGATAASIVAHRENPEVLASIDAFGGPARVPLAALRAAVDAFESK